MIRLPDFDTPGSSQSTVVRLPVTRYGAKAEWGGPTSLGPNTAKQADALRQGWGAVHADEAERRLTQRQLEEEEHLDSLAADLAPEEIEGFAERVIGDYFERAKGFKQTLPETVRPAIDKKLAGHEQNLFARAASIENRERTRAAREGLDGSLRDTLLPAVVAAAQLSPDDPDKPARLAGAEIQAARLIDGNPSLRPHEKEARKAAASAMIHAAFAEALPEAEKRDLDAEATIETLGGRIRRLTLETTPNDTADGLDDFDEGEAAPSNVDGFGREAWLGLVRRHRPELAAGRTNAALLAMRADAELSADLRERGFAESGRYLSDNGHAPSPANLYLAHSSSPEGAAALLDADPEALAAEIDPVAARDRPGLFFEDGDPERPRTAGETIALAEERMAGARVADWRQRLAGVSPDLLQALARDAGEATARQAAEARLAEDAAYRTQLEETDQAIDDGGFGLAALHKASGNDGWLRDPADIDRLRERIAARSAETAAYRDAAERYADPQEQFDPASPDDQGAVDLIYRLGPAKDGAGLAEGDATAQRVLDQIIDRTGIVPTKAAALMASMEEAEAGGEEPGIGPEGKPVQETLANGEPSDGFDQYLRDRRASLTRDPDDPEQDPRAHAVGQYLLNESVPAQIAKTTLGAVTLPGDVFAGRVGPGSQEAIERAADLAGLVTLGGPAAPRGSLGIGFSRPPRGGKSGGAGKQNNLRLAVDRTDTETGAALPIVEVKTTKMRSSDAVRGTPEFDALNNAKPNTVHLLDNGKEFRTNAFGHAEQVAYNPVRDKRGRNKTQTEVGKAGKKADVGGHVQGASLGGSSDRFNLIPQDANFNNSAFKTWENEIRRNIDKVDGVKITLIRKDPSHPRPDKLEIEYVIGGASKRKRFNNGPGDQ